MAHAEQLRSSDIYQALKPGLAAEKIDSTPSTRSSLATTLTSTMRIAVIPDVQEVNGVAFSPDGHTLAATTSDFHGGDGKVQLWDIANRIPIHTASISDGLSVTAVAFSSNGHTLATGSSDFFFGGGDGKVQLWDVANHTARTHSRIIPDGHEVTGMAFSPDGQTLATTTSVRRRGGGTLQLRDVADRAAPIRTATVPDNQHVTAVAFSPMDVLSPPPPPVTRGAAVAGRCNCGTSPPAPHPPAPPPSPIASM